MHISMHSCLRIHLLYSRGPSSPLKAHNYHSFFSSLCCISDNACTYPRSCPCIPFSSSKNYINALPHSESLVTKILRRNPPAANPVCTSKQFIQGYIKHTAYDQNLLAHRFRLLSLPVAGASLLFTPNYFKSLHFTSSFNIRGCRSQNFLDSLRHCNRSA